MRKLILFLFILNVLCVKAYAQQKKIDSLLAKLNATNPAQAGNLVGQLEQLPGSGAILLKDGRKNLENAKLSDDIPKQELALMEICTGSAMVGDDPVSLDAALQGTRISKDGKNSEYLPFFLEVVGSTYMRQGDFRHAVNSAINAAKLWAAKNNTGATIYNYSMLETAYTELKIPDSAGYFARQELILAKRLNGQNRWYELFLAYSDMGEALMAVGKLDSALICYSKCNYLVARYLHPDGNTYYSENNLAKVYMRLGKPDSAIKYSLDAYGGLVKYKMWGYIVTSAGMLAKLYENRDPSKCIFYLKAQLAAQDTLTDRVKRLQLVGYRQQQQQQELIEKQDRLNSRIRLYGAMGTAVVLLIIGGILWRNNHKQKQTNALLSEQKEEIESQRDNLENALSDLRTAQSQLVQAEKMASLGELTAGIAHEIQNPLNFVNNFSELSVELLAELKEEEQKGNKEDVLAIADDLALNLQKIAHHGKRADGIVKGMLEHSRMSAGQKEPADLNKLGDEYLRLAYHGLRAKDKSFNAELITRFDKKLPKINVIPQDMGRVLLNLFNNAFYATNQKSKTAGAPYKPVVEVSTAQQNGSVIISVKDNGNGIPEAIKEKIMQPFFTTKPTGEGTGLGLSLSYDIVVKGYSGKIDISTREGEFTEFVVSLPIS